MSCVPGTAVGVYVDVANITLNGGRGMRYDVLRAFAARNGALPQRLNAYVAYDRLKATEDADYRHRTLAFHDRLRDYGYKVVTKDVTWYVDEDGVRYPKANVDMTLAVDALLQSAGLDRVLLVTGDGDFTQVASALQNRGTRVEVVAFQNVSRALREEADYFISGYLIPNLQPTNNGPSRDHRWGEIGSRVRGSCYQFFQEKGFGFLRFIKQPELENANLWITDSRDADSPYETAFVHVNTLPRSVAADSLPSRRIFLEFELAAPIKEGDSPQAINVELAGRI